MQSIIKNKLLSGIILLAVGILMLIAPTEVLATYVRIVGAVLLCGAIVRIVSHFLTKKEDRVPVSLLIGVVAAIFGIFFLAGAGAIINAVHIVFGILLILNSLLDLVIGVRLPSGKGAAMVLSLLGILAGIFVIVNPAVAASIITRIIGCALIYEAAVGIVTAILARKTAKSNLLQK